MLPTSTVSSEIQFGVINNNSTSSTPVVTGFKFGVPDKDSKSDSAPPSSGFKFAIPSVPGFETVASAEKSKQVASCNSKLNSNTVSSVEVVHPVEKDVLTVSSRREDNGSTANTSVEAVKDPKVDSVKIAANELTSASIEKVEFPATLPFATPLPSVATTSTTSCKLPVVVALPYNLH